MLNSWKEIASYLDRGVRTVQRWERDLHLPVHRIGKGRRSPVYALVPELKFWLITSQAELGRSDKDPQRVGPKPLDPTHPGNGQNGRQDPDSVVPPTDRRIERTGAHHCRGQCAPAAPGRNSPEASRRAETVARN